MVAHPIFHNAHRRQNDPVAVPTADGISNTALTVAGTAAGASLAVDNSVSATQESDPTFINTATVPDETTTSSIDEPTPSSDIIPESDSGNNEIPIGTVIGACVGALAGAALIILLGIWLYKRSTPASHRRKGTGISSHRNAHGENARSRSRLENWNKLDEVGEDSWEHKYQTKDIPQRETIQPMEKLSNFKKSPSVKTARTHKSEHAMVELAPHPFAQYHPNLAQELASADDMPPHPYLAKPDTGPALSWDDESLGKDSFLSLRSNRMSGAMSPTHDMSKQTPEITSSQPHYWESAEVLHYDGQTAHTLDDDNLNPFVDYLERRKSGNNPFFNAQSSQAHVLPKRHSRTSIAPSTMTDSTAVATLNKVDKGKGRDYTGSDTNPFEDNMGIRPPKLTHTTAVSTSSISSNDRAIQSLLAVLDVSAEEVQERLRVASMQPSIISNNESVYTAASALDAEEDVTGAFPLPPSNHH